VLDRQVRAAWFGSLFSYMRKSGDQARRGRLSIDAALITGLAEVRLCGRVANWELSKATVTPISRRLYPYWSTEICHETVFSDSGVAPKLELKVRDELRSLV